MSIVIIVLIALFVTCFKPATRYTFDKEQSSRLKGILAVLIVMLHSNKGGIVDEQWGNVIVSMFLFITGYGLMLSYSKNKDLYLSHYFFNRFFKLLFPLIVTTVIYTAIWSIAGYGSHTNWFNYFIKTGIPPIGATWYIYFVLFFYMLFYFVIRIVKRLSYQMFFFIIGTILYVIVIKYICRWGNFWWCNSFAFIAGISFQIYEEKIKQLCSNSLMYRFYILILFVIITLLLVLYFSFNILFVLILLVSIFPICIITLIYNYGIPKIKILTILGYISYELYILHDVFISFLYTFNISSSFLKFLIVFVMSMPAVYLLNWFDNKLFVYIKSKK